MGGKYPHPGDLRRVILVVMWNSALSCEWREDKSRRTLAETAQLINKHGCVFTHPQLCQHDKSFLMHHLCPGTARFMELCTFTGRNKLLWERRTFGNQDALASLYINISSFLSSSFILTLLTTIMNQNVRWRLMDRNFPSAQIQRAARRSRQTVRFGDCSRTSWVIVYWCWTGFPWTAT